MSRLLAGTRRWRGWVGVKIKASVGVLVRWKIIDTKDAAK